VSQLFAIFVPLNTSLEKRSRASLNITEIYYSFPHFYRKIKSRKTILLSFVKRFYGNRQIQDRRIIEILV
ncbi:hypothetical protein, partial [Bacteroides uniformis]|uniref:hypothetical protein n=1 Tax=Bacteroides uniformis TaxID=820 RepID=UPI001E532E12